MYLIYLQVALTLHAPVCIAHVKNRVTSIYLLDEICRSNLPCKTIVTRNVLITKSFSFIGQVSKSKRNSTFQGEGECSSSFRFSVKCNGKLQGSFTAVFLCYPINDQCKLLFSIQMFPERIPRNPGDQCCKFRRTRV